MGNAAWVETAARHGPIENRSQYQIWNPNRARLWYSMRVNVGSTHAPHPRNPWALARTSIVLAGLGFVISSLAVACLDHYDEAYGTCAPDAGLDTDCGAEAGADAFVGSGSGPI